MANIIFDRYYKITFVSVSKETPRAGTPTDNSVTYLDEYTITSDDSKDGLSSLQVYGNTKKSLKSAGDSPDSALTLNIVNLPSDVNARLNAATLLKVSVSLGYKNASEGDAVTNPIIGEVFNGDVKSYTTSHDGLNFVTSIRAVTGAVEKAGATVNAVFRKGVPLRLVLKRIVDSFSEVYINAKDGTQKKITKRFSVVFEGGTLDGVSLDNDRAFEGMTAKVLEELCKEFKISWTLEGGQVLVYDLNSRDTSYNYTKLDLEPQNVIGGLGYGSENAGKNEKDTETNVEVTMNTFLDPRVGSQTLISIPKSMDKGGLSFSGNYLPTAWMHRFTYRGGTYETSYILNRTNKKEFHIGTDTR